MSTNAVMMRIRSFLNTLLSRLTQRRRRHCPSDYSGQCDDREEVRDHFDELRRDNLISLQLDLKSLGRSEQHTRKPGAHWIPTAEDYRGNRNESAACSHLIGELMLVEGEIHATERGQYSRESNGCILDGLHTNPDARRSLGMLTHRANPESESRAVEKKRENRCSEQTHPEQWIVEPESTLTRGESADARRIGRAVEGQLEKEARDSDHKKIHRDPNYDLIGSKPDCRDGVDQTDDEATENPAQHSDPHAAGVVRAQGSRERTGQHEPLEREAEYARPLGDDAAARREKVRYRDAKHLRQERERIHARAGFRAC